MPPGANNPRPGNKRADASPASRYPHLPLAMTSAGLERSTRILSYDLRIDLLDTLFFGRGKDVLEPLSSCHPGSRSSRPLLRGLSRWSYTVDSSWRDSASPK